MGLLRNLQSEIEQRGLTGLAGKADTLALRSRLTYTPSGIPKARQVVVDVLNKPAEMQHAVAGLLSKRTWERAEKSGKLGPQAVESNEINVMEKTLNQQVGGSIPPRLIESRAQPTGNKSATAVLGSSTGANTKVIEVVLDKIAYGWSPEEMHLQHPHLSLAQIHAALSYYYEHQKELDSDIARRHEEVERMAAESADSPLSQAAEFQKILA